MVKKVLILLLISTKAFCQVKIGQDIQGEGNFSNVVLSSYGNIVAVSDTSQGNATKVYEEISGVWSQIGQNIPIRGFSVSLSSFGNIVPVGDNLNNNVNGIKAGAVGVYEFDMGIWKQKGQTIYGKSLEEQSGFIVSLSSNGNTVAIGAPYKDWQGNFNSPEGVTRVYNFNNISKTWNQVGQDINGNGWGYYSGTSVSLSADGNVLAVDTIFESSSGVVRVYRNVNGIWTQIGQTIKGDGTGDRFGRSVSLSSDGTIIAVGGYRNNGNGLYKGHVRVYKNISNVWTQIGTDIYGQANFDQAGFSVSLSADGSMLAVGAFMEARSPSTGGTQIYKNISNVWTKVYNDINFGYYVSLSSNGERVAVKRHGTTKVFDLRSASNNTFSENDFSIYPNPATDILNITINENLILEKVTFYNTLGQVVKVANYRTVNISNLSPGVYFVEVYTNIGKAVKKLIVK